MFHLSLLTQISTSLSEMGKNKPLSVLADLSSEETASLIAARCPLLAAC